MPRPYVMYGVTMILHLIKWGVDVGEWVLSHLLFNRDLPPVGRFVADIPYGRDRQQRFDLIIPQGPPPYPVLVFVHGGAWVAGDKATYTRICRSFAAQGFLVINANYRLGPRHVYPAGFQDVARVVQWAFENGPRHGADVTTFFLAGDSAGAHIVSWYAAAQRTRELLVSAGIDKVVPTEAVRGLLLFYGVYDCEAVLDSGLPFVDRLGQKLLGVKRSRMHDVARDSSPLKHIGRDFPPCFVTAGEADPLCPQSVAMAEALKLRGIPHRVLIFSRKEHANAYHAFLNFYKRGCSKTAMREAVAFMRGLKS